MSIGPLPATPDIPRTDPDPLAGERDGLRQWLDYQRATLKLNCAGLDESQLKARPLATSMSLLGLLRHLTEVERGWFVDTLAGEATAPLYYSEADPDGDFDRLDSHPVAEVYALYEATLDRARAIEASFDGPDDLRRNANQRPRTLRWVMTHLVEEYARHNGHADLLREAIDGAVGD